MVDITPQRLEHAERSTLPLLEFATVAGVSGVGLLFLSSLFLSTPVVVVLAYVFALAFISRGLMTSYPHAKLGLCNSVTLVRVALLSLLVGALFEAMTVSGWMVFTVSLSIFVLDGVDGWAARRAGLQSKFGARFDMETDAALGAVLALYVLATGIAGAHVLVLGGLRYVFILAGVFLPALKMDLPDSFRRKAICVVQISALIVLVCPVTPSPVLLPLSVLASGLLAYSFLVDTVWLLRQKT